MQSSVAPDAVKKHPKKASNFRHWRIKSMGLLHLGSKAASDFLQDIKRTGKARVKDKVADIEQRETPNKLAALVKKLEQSGYEYQAYARCLMDDVSGRGDQVLAWYKQAIKEEPVTMNEWLSGEVSLNALRTNFSAVIDDLNQRLDKLSIEAQASGKALDHEWRKKLFDGQIQIDDYIQLFWQRVGLANQQQMKEVNRKLMVIATILEKQNQNKLEAVKLNRRKVERRVSQQPVAFDKRLRQRREDDRIAS